MAERWTRARRLEHTRSLLIDAASELFARSGFHAASLDDIAEAAGYTRGAIYVHFTTKEELFVAACDRQWSRLALGIAEVCADLPGVVAGDEVDVVAQRWRGFAGGHGVLHAALGQEFALYLARHPDAKTRVAGQRARMRSSVVASMREALAAHGLATTIPVDVFVELLIATGAAVVLAGEVSGLDLFEPLLQLFTSAITPDTPL